MSPRKKVKAPKAKKSKATWKTASQVQKVNCAGLRGRGRGRELAGTHLVCDVRLSTSYSADTFCVRQRHAPGARQSKTGSSQLLSNRGNRYSKIHALSSQDPPAAILRKHIVLIVE